MRRQAQHKPIVQMQC